MAKTEVPNRKHHGDQYYGDDHERELAKIPFNTKGQDPISYTGEGFFSGAKEGIRNGFILAVVAFGIVGYGIGRVVIPMATLAGANKAASNLDALEFQKSRLLLKERVLATLSESTSYNKDSRGNIALTPEAKSTLKSELESLSEFPGVRQRPEYRALEITFLSNEKPSSPQENNAALKLCFDQFKSSYKDDWRKISKALIKIGEDADMTLPTQIGNFPTQFENAIVK